MTQGNSNNGKHLLGLAYNFTGPVHYHHSGKHGILQAYLVLKEPIVLDLDPKAARVELEQRDLKAHPHSDTSSGKIPPPNSAKHSNTRIYGAKPIQTTTFTVFTIQYYYYCCVKPESKGLRSGVVPKWLLPGETLGSTKRWFCHHSGRKCH